MWGVGGREGVGPALGGQGLGDNAGKALDVKA